MFNSAVKNFFYSFAVVAVTAVLASLFNQVGMESFYDSIQLSELNPPNYVFPLVWGILYVILIAVFYLILEHTKQKDKKIRPAIQLFLANMFLQVLWCYAFFYCGHFLAGLVIIVVLDIMTMIMMEVFYKLNRAAGLMLIPYLLWLLFASYSNWSVVMLNGVMFVI